MTSPITAVSIAGTALNLAGIEYAVTVSHGRSDILSPSSASQAEITLFGDINAVAEITDTFTITAYSDARFTGTVTDVRVEFLGDGTARTTITGIGLLAQLGSTLVDVNFPNEQVDERVETILAATGLSYLNGASSALELFSVNEDIPQPATTLLDELAQWSGGTYFDTPDGRVVFESYGIRGETANPGNWQSQTQTWAELTREWDSFPTVIAALALPASSVVYAPTWTKTQQGLVNEVSVTHGSPAAVTTYTDSASVALYGLRATEITTGLRNLSDANARGAAILLAQAYPLWGLGQISVLVHTLSAPVRDLLMVALNGTTIRVDSLPSQGPYTQFLGICEGWTEVYTPGEHVLTLSLSDPRMSYETVTWAGVDAALTWAGVDPDLEWYNVVTAGDLAA
jgi:hypothetical protein